MKGTQMLFCKKMATAFVLMSCFIAQAQNYPEKPIRIVTSFSAGSGPDALMRNVGDKVGKQVGQAIIIDNRPGAKWLVGS
jgi:tripartite-type tricarboxylate transporter receptor subunit TctC